MADYVPFTTSWDDGAPSDARIADLLTDLGLLGTFYASTGPGGHRSIDDAGLARIGSLHELGNHGRSHTPFTALSDDAIEAELAWGMTELEPFGRVARVVAPPRGKLDARVISFLVGQGYAIRTAPILGPRTTRRAGLLEPSFMFYPHDWQALFRNTARRATIPAVPLLLAWLRGGDFRDIALRLVRAAAARLGYVHLWGHSADVERFGLWEVLHDVLTASARLHVRPATNGDLLAILAASKR
jgi:peptidoglycan/xylan/chitin deacetylase (PgdA/CDA1 family)